MCCPRARPSSQRQSSRRSRKSTQEGAYKAALEKWGVEQGAISDFAVNPTP